MLRTKIFKLAWLSFLHCSLERSNQWGRINQPKAFALPIQPLSEATFWKQLFIAKLLRWLSTSFLVIDPKKPKFTVVKCIKLCLKHEEVNQISVLPCNWRSRSKYLIVWLVLSDFRALHYWLLVYQPRYGQSIATS